MKQKKAYKYRIYPTDEQASILARTFGCCRFVYNWALRQRTDAFFQHGQRLYYHQLAVMLTDLKKHEESAWLSEVSSVFFLHDSATPEIYTLSLHDALPI